MIKKRKPHRPVSHVDEGEDAVECCHEDVCHRQVHEEVVCHTPHALVGWDYTVFLGVYIFKCECKIDHFKNWGIPVTIHITRQFPKKYKSYSLTNKHKKWMFFAQPRDNLSSAFCKFWSFLVFPLQEKKLNGKMYQVGMLLRLRKMPESTWDPLWSILSPPLIIKWIKKYTFSTDKIWR